MLKCQEAGKKLIAFCHKHSLINMIAFAYFILLLICCLNDSCDSPAPVPTGKFSLLLKHEVFLGLIRDFPSARPLRKQYDKHMSARECWITVDEEQSKTCTSTISAT